jgi:hypothetical protein
MSNEFLLRFQEFLGKNGWPTEASPWSIIEQWEGFVEECSNCYQWGFYEFDNEVRVRGLLEKAITDPGLVNYEQAQAIRERVGLADERFRELLYPTQIRTEEAPWWRRGVLAHAGEEYREDIKRLYNVDVKPC